MKLSFLLLVCVIIAGCGTTRDNPSANELFDIYRNAQSAFNQPHETTFYAEHVWQSLVQARQTSDKSIFTNTLANYPNHLATLKRTLSEINQNTGCLLVGGLSNDNKPLEYYISFEKLGGNWRVSDITVHYFLDDEKPFLDAAVCDQKQRQAYWLKSLNN